MAMIEIAMLGKLPYTALQNAIFAHPTWPRSLNNLFWNENQKSEFNPSPTRGEGYERSGGVRAF